MFKLRSMNGLPSLSICIQGKLPRFKPDTICTEPFVPEPAGTVIVPKGAIVVPLFIGWQMLMI
jgi:hypothetical protein